MPTIVKGTTTITYSAHEVLSMIAVDVSKAHGKPIKPSDVVPVYEGGYASCDCASWGGPTMCSCKESTKTLVGFKIVVNNV